MYNSILSIANLWQVFSEYSDIYFPNLILCSTLGMYVGATLFLTFSFIFEKILCLIRHFLIFSSKGIFSKNQFLVIILGEKLGKRVLDFVHFLLQQCRLSGTDLHDDGFINASWFHDFINFEQLFMCPPEVKK